MYILVNVFKFLFGAYKMNQVQAFFFCHTVLESLYCKYLGVSITVQEKKFFLKAWFFILLL